MPDDIDRAQLINENHFKAALQTVLERPPIPFSGFCLSCGEPVKQRRFCDAYCREDFENRRK